ncbi:MAG: ORF6N domain-containing protein [Candidatus Binatia bacterium]
MDNNQEETPYTIVVSVGQIEQAIFIIRDQKVLRDVTLAKLYGVETKMRNRAVKRNQDRFPEDFMFQLIPEEAESLRFHFGTSNPSRGGRRYLPYVFTEQGVAMLSSVLRSKRAIQVNVEIMRTFVRLRQMLSSHEQLAHKLNALEKKYDAQFKVVFDAIRLLMEPPLLKRRGIGFHTQKEKET